MIDGQKDGLSIDCPMCSRELVKRETLEDDGSMVLCSYICPGTGMDCSLVSVMVWEDKHSVFRTLGVNCQHGDSAYQLLPSGGFEECQFCGNVRGVR